MKGEQDMDGMEERLWLYIDGFCEAPERSAVEKLLTENAAWRSKHRELLSLHEALQLEELSQPSLRFTKNVMEEIARQQIAPATKRYIDNKVVWGIGGFFIAMIVGFLVYGFAQIDWNAGRDDSAIGIDMSKIDYSRLFDSSLMNGLMMLNVIIGLVFLDRYLESRKEKLRQSA